MRCAVPHGGPTRRIYQRERADAIASACDPSARALACGFTAALAPTDALAGLEKVRPLNVLLTYCRPDLQEVFGPEMVWEIDALFNFRPGRALRHQLAYGKLHSQAFYSPDVISACWLIFYLVVIPTLELWEKEVASMLATSGSSAGGEDAESA